ncbi:transcriptional regulator BetI [Marinobacterium aestuariivivens]|uniref:HTH-type transcriptional regulator BetI n=1 Tax=Marinobacterium aestuariivivens TaxID=1698799 RepID=A0ABW2A138_9GAMM
MPKVGMQPIRRKQLIEATAAAIHRYGYANTTVARISKIAGVSPGIIHHYFDGKADLLAETMRQLMRQLSEDIYEAWRQASTPRARIAAIIDGNFSDTQFAPEVVTCWLAFWAETPHDESLSRLSRVRGARLRSNLLYNFRQLLPADEAGDAALTMASMIDGLWINCALGTLAADATTARRQAHRTLQWLLHENL